MTASWGKKRSQPEPPKTKGNVFTSHGFVPGQPVKPTQVKRKKTSRSEKAFGTKGGSVPGLGHTKK